jgi:hypothetical protein
VLNKLLWDACDAHLGPGKISNENDPGVYRESKNRKYTGGTDLEFSEMTGWGETGYYCCPICGDQSFKLGICHRLGTVYRKKDKSFRFSRYLLKCHRDKGCDMRRVLDRIYQSLPADYAEVAINGKIEMRKSSASSVVAVEVSLPTPSFSLVSNKVSQGVADYLINRGFDLAQLDELYGVRYLPRGAKWEYPEIEEPKTEESATGEEQPKKEKPPKRPPYIFAEEKILIPIWQHRLLIGWQVRTINPQSKPKYLNTPGAHKGTWLYNLDAALLQKDIIITEGVTNVWRIGPQAVAIFGHSMSVDQSQLAKTIWGFDGRALICLDEDTYGKNADRLLATSLRQDEAFPRGVALLRLRNGDASDHARQRMHYLMQLAYEKASTVDVEDDLDILDEATVPPGWPAEFDDLPRIEQPTELQEVLPGDVLVEEEDGGDDEEAEWDL